jgi:2-C-methyl-D-erythritol 4-phosphate cytidylyltransferase
MSWTTAIIVAAGEGRRYGETKQFALLKGKSVLAWCLEKFQAHRDIDSIVLVLGKGQSGKEYCDRFKKISRIAEGGENRQDSVYSGLSCVESDQDGIVLVHDGARPLVGMDLIGRLIQATREKGAVVPVIAVEDTIKCVEANRILRTEDRTRLFRAQTPQGFACSLLKEAFVQAFHDEFDGTDEAVLVERLGKDVYVIPGDRKNIKITTREDMKIAEALIED